MKSKNMVIQCKNGKVKVSLVPLQGWKGNISADVLNRRGTKIGTISNEGHGKWMSHSKSTVDNAHPDAVDTKTHSTEREAVTEVVTAWMDYHI